MIPVASYQPDMADSNPGVSAMAENVIVIRDANGLAHKPQAGLASPASSTALPAAPRGGVSAVNKSGIYTAFVATGSSIYKMNSLFELDASTSVGSGYGLPGGDFWSFARFGANLHASNTFDGIQKFNVDTDSAFSAVSGAPKARYIFTAFNALFALDCDGENRVMQNSVIGNSLLWTGKGANFRTMPNGEELMCGAELSPDFAIILQRNAIRGLHRVNDGRLFEVRRISSGRGVVNPRAFCSTDGVCWFLDSDGFYEYSMANGLRNIGKDKVNRTFLDTVTTGGLEGVEMKVDKVGNRVFIRYQSYNTTSDTVFDDILVYDYLLQEWSTIKQQTTALFNMATPGYTLDDMGDFGPLDSFAIKLDSRFWSGGESRIAALDANLKFSFLDGANLAAKSDSAVMASPRSILVTSITPHTDADNATVSLGVRDALKDSVTWKTGVGIQSSGRCPVRGRGKIIQIRHEVAASESWGFFRGFDQLGDGAKLGGVR